MFDYGMFGVACILIMLIVACLSHFYYFSIKRVDAERAEESKKLNKSKDINDKPTPMFDYRQHCRTLRIIEENERKLRNSYYNKDELERMKSYVESMGYDFVEFLDWKERKNKEFREEILRDERKRRCEEFYGLR